MMISQIARNKTLWVGVLLFGAFASIYFLVPPAHKFTLAEVVNGVLLSVSAAVSIIYVPLVWRALTSKDRGAFYYQVIGIWLVWVSLAGRGAMGLWWRFYGMPPEWPNGFLWLLDLFLAIVAGTLHITAPGTISGSAVPPRNWVIWGIAVMIGGLVGTLIVIWSFGAPP